MKILILCTGNSCRSQMAEGYLKKISDFDIYSAGVNPAERTSSKAIKVMKEIGIDISSSVPKSVEIFLNESFDYVITVCDNANKTCPVFFGKVKYTLYIPFDDPYNSIGTQEEIMGCYRRVRDEIVSIFDQFIKSVL
ncbi:MAG: arsenate reductase ArsC [Candidatus Kapabacteria bacterium]|nr:arsenate reductase ArsC [Candidatus Kapabacteria bacterium]